MEDNHIEEIAQFKNNYVLNGQVFGPKSLYVDNMNNLIVVNEVGHQVIKINFLSK